MNIYTNELGHKTCPYLVKITFKKLLTENRLTDDLQTQYVALSSQFLPRLLK